MKRPVIIGGIVAAALAGGVLAAALPSVVADNFLTGEASLGATCLSTATSVVDISSGPTYQLGAWEITGATVNITDTVSDANIQCNGFQLDLIATDVSGNEIGIGQAIISSANGVPIVEPVVLNSPVNATNIAGWAVAIQ